MSALSGIGYDVHRLAAGRPLVLGGVHLEHERGLEGHSDADVLTHAVIDALLGAAGLGDIGEHFPDSDDRWRGADSLGLLDDVLEMVHDRGLEVVNVDATVIAQAPRLGPHRETIRRSLAGRLDLVVERVNVKATTNEGLGALGREEGMAALAVATLDTRAGTSAAPAGRP